MEPFFMSVRIAASSDSFPFSSPAWASQRVGINQKMALNTARERKQQAEKTLEKDRFFGLRLQLALILFYCLLLSFRILKIQFQSQRGCGICLKMGKSNKEG
jgi:hypothetical protein